MQHGGGVWLWWVEGPLVCLPVSREMVCCVNCGPRGHLSDLGNWSSECFFWIASVISPKRGGLEFLVKINYNTFVSSLDKQGECDLRPGICVSCLNQLMVLKLNLSDLLIWRNGSFTQWTWGPLHISWIYQSFYSREDSLPKLLCPGAEALLMDPPYTSSVWRNFFHFLLLMAFQKF